jgi:plastocyanin
VGGEKCPCTEDLKKGTGILLGTVLHKSVQKFPTVVYVEVVSDTEYLPPNWTLHVDQANKEFLPRVVPMYVGSRVEFFNSDAFEHNVNSPDSEKFNLGNWGEGQKRNYVFGRPGVYTLLCSLHPEMIGYAVVLKTPYFAMANEKGEFRIPNVPPGTWNVKIWNERLKPKQLEKVVEACVETGKEVRIEFKP